MAMGCHYAREHVHISLLYLGNGWTDCAQICYMSRDQYDMWLRQSNGGRQCTCTRAHSTSFLGSRLESWERLNWLCSNLLHEQRPIWYVASTKQWGGGGVSARARVHTPPSFWGLGLNRVIQEPCSAPASSATSAIGFHSNRATANRAAGGVWRHRLTHCGYWRHSPLAFSFVEATSAILKSQKRRKR